MRHIKFLLCLFSICAISGILLLTPLTVSAHSTQKNLQLQQVTTAQLLRGGGGGGHGSGGHSSGGHSSVSSHREESSGGSYSSTYHSSNTYHNTSSYYQYNSCQVSNNCNNNFSLPGCLMLLLLVAIIYALVWAANKRKRRE